MPRNTTSRRLAGISDDREWHVELDSAVMRGTKLVLFAISNCNGLPRGVDSSQHAATKAASIAGHIRAVAPHRAIFRIAGHQLPST